MPATTSSCFAVLGDYGETLGSAELLGFSGRPNLACQLTHKAEATISEELRQMLGSGP
jgi:hypothetical protein